MKLAKEEAVTELKFLRDMSEILSSLAHPDALLIFDRMKDGVESSTKVIKELGLTSKRYYTRLRELIQAGLVEKTENGYKHTVLGEAIYKTVFTGIQDVLANRDRLTLISTLLNSDKLSTSEKQKMIEALNIKTKIFTIEDMLDIKKVLKVVDTYKDLVRTVSEVVAKAEEEIVFTSRYTEFEVADKVYDAINNNVQLLYIDGDKRNLSSKLNIMRMIFAHPRAVMTFYEAINNPNVKIAYYPDLPYSFLVVDRKVGALEIVNPVTKKFVFAI
ncbi:hypothetical protein CP083_03050, partial [Candidatus Bathyarchaeota archaeon B24-2]